MTEILLQPSSVVRTERGLSIAGTRITLYDVLGYIEARMGTPLDSVLVKLERSTDE